MQASVVNKALRRFPPGWLYVIGLIPLGWIIWLTVSGGIGVDPVAAIQQRLGKITLWFLVGGLTITPASRASGVNLIRYRRAIGLLAFFYLCLHMLAWGTLDMGLSWQRISEDLIKRPYLVFGMTGFLLLLPLAATSNNLSIRRMGAHWRRLHRLAYPAVLLGVTHYLWQMKVVTPEGWLWLATALGLLLLRFRSLRRRSARE